MANSYIPSKCVHIIIVTLFQRNLVMKNSFLFLFDNLKINMTYMSYQMFS